MNLGIISQSEDQLGDAHIQACAVKIDQLKLRSQYDAFKGKRKNEQMKEKVREKSKS